MKTIKYLKHQEINLELWDASIDRSYNGLVYAYSFVLNSLGNEKWDALVYGDYEAVMPLVWGSKYGLKYLYQPYFCQQLGVFSKAKISDELLGQFIKSIPSKFRFWDIHLNYWNKYYQSNINFINRTSFNIDLNDSYINLYDKYNSDAKKNLAKLSLKAYSIKKDDSIGVPSSIFFETYGKFYKNTEKLRLQIEDCGNLAIKQGKGFIRSIYGEGGELWCSGFFFHAKGRIHYAMAAPTEIGKKHSATHALIDEVLKEFAETQTIFDFEGSDIENVAYFYAKFGSEKHHYLEIIYNNLPWLVNILRNRKIKA